MLGVRDIILLEKLLRRLAEMAGRGRVNGDWFASHGHARKLIVNQYTTSLSTGAGYENRTRIYCLGSSRSTTKLIPQVHENSTE